MLSIGLALLFQILLKNSQKQKAVTRPYFTYFLIIVAVIYFLLLILSLLIKKLDRKLVHSDPFYAGVALFLNLLNIITAKYALLPVLFFPSIDRVIEMYVKDGLFLNQMCCLFFEIVIGRVCMGRFNRICNRNTSWFQQTVCLLA